MDIGANLCTPQSPQCEKCPLIKLCLARIKGIEQERPILKPKPVQPQFTYVGAIIQKDDSFLLTKRPSRGLLGGLWEFPNDRISSDEDDLENNLTHLVSTRFGIKLKIIRKRAIIRHAYTHFRLILHAYSCKWIEDSIDIPVMCYWIPRNELPNYPMGKVARQISRIIIKDGV
jgi:A/G-specific adenine glycosylase